MKKVLLIGNDINNVSNTTSWENLLNKIIEFSGNDIEITQDKSKPFPLLYEEIYLRAKQKSNNMDELKFKEHIANIVSNIEPNVIHNELLKLDCQDFITTNYDYVLQKSLLKGKSTKNIQNVGIIKESKYSVFRHNVLNDKNFWHIHGEINVPNSITLGFEHYGGQLQQFRNYTVTGTSYKSKEIETLYNQLKNNSLKYHSWIDYFFKDEIHIIGLRLGYEESDLWWLLTIRARYMYEKFNVENRIFYYCPENYKDNGKHEIMEATNIEPVYLAGEGLEFYENLIQRINN